MKIDWEEFYIEIIRIDARIYDWKKIERANIFLFDQFDFIYLIILQMQMATWIYVNFSKETGNIKNRRYQQWYIYISLSFSLFRLQQKWHDLNAINFWEKKIFYLFVYR